MTAYHRRGRTIVHGTYSGYTHGACRCAACTTANREACAARRHGHGPGNRERSHGTTFMYHEGCRCDECSAAKRLARQHHYLAEGGAGS